MEGDAAAPASRCPRCGCAFHCGAHDAAPCACATAQLTPELRAMLCSRWTGCLCLRCLRTLSRACASPGDDPDGEAARGSARERPAAQR